MFSPCGTPKIRATRISIHTGLSPVSVSMTTHATICPAAPTSSLPRTPLRRPETTETPMASRNMGICTSPAWKGESPKPSSVHCVNP